MALGYLNVLPCVTTITISLAYYVLMQSNRMFMLTPDAYFFYVMNTAAWGFGYHDKFRSIRIKFMQLITSRREAILVTVTVNMM